MSSLIPSLSWLSMVVLTKHGERLSLLKNRWNVMFPLVDRYEKPTPLLAKTPHQISLSHTFSMVNPWFWKVVWWLLMVVESHYFHPGNCGQYTHTYIYMFLLWFKCIYMYICICIYELWYSHCCELYAHFFMVNRCSEILTLDGDGKLILYINYIRLISIPWY